MTNKNKKILSSIFTTTMGLSTAVAIPVAITSCTETPKISATLSADSRISDAAGDDADFLDSELIFTFVSNDPEIGKLDNTKMKIYDVKLTLENGSTEFPNISGGDNSSKLTEVSVLNEFWASGNIYSYAVAPHFYVKEDGSVEMRWTQANVVKEVASNGERYSFMYDKEGDLDNKMKVSAEIFMSYDGEESFTIKVPTEIINVGPKA